MTKKKNLLLLLATTLLLSGCATNSNDDSATSDSGTSTSETSSSTKTVSGSWNDEQKDLLQTYCGEVLPYPADGYLNGEVTVSDNYGYLEISDTASSSFTLADYYLDLVEAGWTVSTGYNNKPVRTTYDSSGKIEYCELTKLSDDSLTGYRIYYYLTPETEDEASHHVIRCFNNMEVNKTTYEDWSFDEYKIEETLTFSLPFMQLGDEYSVTQNYFNTDMLVINDNYVANLAKDYADLLVDDGFTLLPEDSKQADAFVLAKQINDSTVVLAALSYFNGNQFVFYYRGQYQEYTSWPSDVLKLYEEKSNVKVTQFTSNNGKYYCRVKGEVIDIYGYVDSANTTDMAYYNTLLEEGYSYTSNYSGAYYLSWSEKLKIESYTTYDEKQTFGIKVSLYDTDYVLSNTWPTDAISTVAKKYGIELDIPSVTLVDTTRPIKYQISEYTTGGFRVGIVIYDPDDSGTDCSYDLYYSQLKNLGWHYEQSYTGDDVFEDPTGSVKITLSWVESIFNVTIESGSGKSHEPVFKFEEEEVILLAGSTYNPVINIDMLPYEVTYTSSNDHVTVSKDEYGDPVINVSNEATVGETATIEAKVTIPTTSEVKTTSLTVTVVDRIPYTLTSAVDAFAKLYSDFAQQNVERYGDDPFIDTNSSKSSTYYEENISSFLPEGFTLVGTWADGTVNNSYDSWNNGASCRYVDATCVDGITLRFYSFYDDYTCGYNLCVYAFKTATTSD